MSWTPKMGDKLTMTMPFNEHGYPGMVVTVLQINTSMEVLVVDHCSCKTDHAKTSKWAWPWVRDHGYFLPYSEISEEEAKKAPPLPSPDDVASFFRVKL